MEEDTPIKTDIDRLLGLFEKHLGVRASTLEIAVRRAGRRLPRTQRARAAQLVQAEQFAAHPKLMRRINSAETGAAAKALGLYLETQDVARERSTRRLNTLAGLAFNMLILFALLIVVLRWRGLI